MTGRYHAYIIDDGGDLKVRPAIASLDRLSPFFEDGAVNFTIRNLTPYTATVSFPRQRPVPSGWSPSRRSGIIPAGGVGTIPIARTATGLYWYEVRLGPSGGKDPVVKARGESGPGMIIDP